jgi:hypothetical protein
MTNLAQPTWARPETRLGFSRAGGARRFRAAHGTTIPLDQLASLAPSIFAQDRHESCSERYTYIDTSAVLQTLIKEGFMPVAVQQGGSRIEGKREFTKHVVNFRHRRDMERAAPRHVGEVYPEVSLLNSHDGTSAYTLAMDLFRLVCLNGMQVNDGTIERIKVPHKGDVGGQIIEGAFRVIDRAPEVMDSVQAMSGLILTPPERLAFATAARELRWTAEEAPIDAGRLLQPRRAADAGADLWRTFNITQEHLLRGGDTYQRVTEDPETGRRQVQNRRVGEVRSIDQSGSLNRALWTLAAEMQKLKEGGQ